MTITTTNQHKEHPMSTIHDAYADLVQTMRHLGRELEPAVAARYDAPPASGATKQKSDKGVTNPTLEIVLDARRSAVSEEIDATASALRQATALLAPHVSALRSAVARWEGRPDVPVG